MSINRLFRDHQEFSYIILNVCLLWHKSVLSCYFHERNSQELVHIPEKLACLLTQQTPNELRQLASESVTNLCMIKFDYDIFFVIKSDSFLCSVNGIFD